MSQHRRHSQPGSRSGGSSGSGSRGKTPRQKHDRKQGDATGQPRRRDLRGAAVGLPNWVVEALVRVTPADRVADALEELGEASAALTEGRFQAAARHGRKAKALSSQDSTIRETLGIAAYRLSDWDTALRELRAYRRMSGDTTHMPVEMDVLRAKGRSGDVARTWVEMQRLGGPAAKAGLQPGDLLVEVDEEALTQTDIVYASHLLDEGDADGAWDLTQPKRMRPDAQEADLRIWYVAARAAARRGDPSGARELADAIVVADPGFPGFEELEAEIRKASR